MAGQVLQCACSRPALWPPHTLRLSRKSYAIWALTRVSVAGNSLKLCSLACKLICNGRYTHTSYACEPIATGFGFITKKYAYARSYDLYFPLPILSQGPKSHTIYAIIVKYMAGITPHTNLQRNLPRPYRPQTTQQMKRLLSSP